MSGEQRQWWIGATDVASEGVWWWPHSHRLVDFTAWGLGEPNKKQTENYSLLFSGKSYKWVDIRHDGTPVYTICQKM